MWSHLDNNTLTTLIKLVAENDSNLFLTKKKNHNNLQLMITQLRLRDEKIAQEVSKQLGLQNNILPHPKKNKIINTIGSKELQKIFNRAQARLHLFKILQDLEMNKNISINDCKIVQEYIRKYPKEKGDLFLYACYKCPIIVDYLKHKPQFRSFKKEAKQRFENILHIPNNNNETYRKASVIIDNILENAVIKACPSPRSQQITQKQLENFWLTLKDKSRLLYIRTSPIFSI